MCGEIGLFRRLTRNWSIRNPVPREQLQTTPFLTRFELARVVGTRALDISLGVSWYVVLR